MCPESKTPPRTPPHLLEDRSVPLEEVFGSYTEPLNRSPAAIDIRFLENNFFSTRHSFYLNPVSRGFFLNRNHTFRAPHPLIQVPNYDVVFSGEVRVFTRSKTIEVTANSGHFCIKPDGTSTLSYDNTFVFKQIFSAVAPLGFTQITTESQLVGYLKKIKIIFQNARFISLLPLEYQYQRLLFWVDQ